jgi:hypothetical protein
MSGPVVMAGDELKTVFARVNMASEGTGWALNMFSNNWDAFVNRTEASRFNGALFRHLVPAGSGGVFNPPIADPNFYTPESHPTYFTKDIVNLQEWIDLAIPNYRLNTVQNENSIYGRAEVNNPRLTQNQITPEFLGRWEGFDFSASLAWDFTIDPRGSADGRHQIYNASGLSTLGLQEGSPAIGAGKFVPGISGLNANMGAAGRLNGGVLWYYLDGEPKVTDVSNASFVSILPEGGRSNARVWILTFTVSVVRSDETVVTEKVSINLAGNNANLGGRFVFDEDHLLSGYTLTYDIKGNGSNIKAFSIR